MDLLIRSFEQSCGVSLAAGTDYVSVGANV